MKRKVIVIIDKKNGLLFNNRRQSRDRNLCQEILRLVGECDLYMTCYSYSIFEEFDRGNIKVCDEPLQSAAKDAYVFWEGALPDLDYEEILLCRWDKVYPADTVFEVSLVNYKMIERHTIHGSSHEKIEVERWKK